jgi:uncharacterized membrane protein YsdA (DUF1294 family)
MSNQISSTPIAFEQVFNIPTFRNQLTLTAQLCREVQRSETLVTVQALLGSLEAALCNQISRRKQLQKSEFLTIWAFLLLLNIGPMYHGNAPFDLASTVHTLAFLYLEVQLLTHMVAYAIDLTNAREKRAKLSSWLILHHFGVPTLRQLYISAARIAKRYSNYCPFSQHTILGLRSTYIGSMCSLV